MKQFRVLNSDEIKDAPILGNIPWDFIAPFEERAMKNYCGQSLEILNQRGGLSPVEMYAVVNDLTVEYVYTRTSTLNAVKWIVMKINEELIGDSIVRGNLLTEKGYSPYCGNDKCIMPRTMFHMGQFTCPKCGWVSEFPEEFITKYKQLWNIR